MKISGNPDGSLNITEMYSGSITTNENVQYGLMLRDCGLTIIIEDKHIFIDRDGRIDVDGKTVQEAGKK